MSRRQRRSMSQINVVPYIDVMLVLLIIFMVTAPMINPAQVALPSIGQSSQLPIAPLEVTLKLDGSLTLRDLAQGSERPFTDREVLIQAIQDKQRSGTPQPVVIAADKKIRYEAVLNIMDALQRANVQKVGLLVEPSHP